MNLTRAGLALAILLPALSCSPGYVLRAAWEEAHILLGRRPIGEILDDPSTDPSTRARLELVVQARSFAGRHLRLDVGESYTSFTRIERDTLALILSASPVDRLAAYTWWFPIVGRVPYKGFFSREGAERERRRLHEKGYDTYLRTTSAFSTLGWLPDPLLSTVLARDSVALVETVIHEVTHNTLFVPGQVKFNESFANFVGSVGAIEFFCRAGDGSACRTARDRWHDTLLFGRFLDELWDQLHALYARDLPRERVLAERRALLQRAGERYRQRYTPRMRTGFAEFDPTRLNNASLIARHLYYHRLQLFQQLHRHAGSVARMIELVTARVEEERDPWAAVRTLTGSTD